MNGHILCIDDDVEFLLSLKIQLKKNYHVMTAPTLKEGLQILHENTVDLILLDIRLGSENGIDGLSRIKSGFPATDVVILSGYRDPKMIVTAIRAGASDYLCKPFAHDELLAVIEKIQKLGSMRERRDAFIRDSKMQEPTRPLIGTSKIFQDLLKQVECVRGHDANILLEGESGTGKELLARYIHNLESQSHRPFIAINCAAIPESLIESELFGHEKGAFSGACQRKIGKFELADGGDIFLDEINSLKPDLQAKILRALQEHEIYRVGGSQPVKIQFRVISATNANLETLMRSGTFRMDLFHRLRVVSFVIPPLRERREDIPSLVDFFRHKFILPKQNKQFDADVMHAMQNYDWPGNVRELENLVRSLLIMAPGPLITSQDLPDWMSRQKVSITVPKDNLRQFVLPDDETQVVRLKAFVQEAERTYVSRILRMKQGDKSKAAEVLGISRTSLYEKLKNATMI